MKIKEKAIIMEKRNISAKLEEDYAIKANLLETAIRLAGEKKSDRDLNLVKISLDSLAFVYNECKIHSGKEYPTEVDIRNFLSKKGENTNLI